MLRSTLLQFRNPNSEFGTNHRATNSLGIGARSRLAGVMMSLLTTPVHAWHVAHGGRMVDLAGGEMPVQYTSIVSEHNAVRKAAGLFDIAHMGRLKFTGPDAARFLDYLVTNDVASLAVGQIKYALVTNEEGGILDDVLVYRLADCHLLVVNASNRLKILDWISQHQSRFTVTVEDQTLTHFMLALQGPRALSLLAPLVDVDLPGIKYYVGTPAKVLGQPGFVSRTGYTGEDGVEVIVPASSGRLATVGTTDCRRNAGRPLSPAGLELPRYAPAGNIRDLPVVMAMS